VSLLEDAGYAGFSVRELAARCGVTTPTVNHHLGSRAEVLVAVVDHVLQPVPVVAQDLAWEDAVRITAAGFREALRRHPRLGPLIVDVAAHSPAGLRLSVHLLLQLARGGVPRERLLEVHRAVLGFVTGWCVQETGGGLAGVGHPGVMAQLDVLADDADRADFTALLLDLAADARRTGAGVATASFNRALDALLDGLRASLSVEIS
jgi:AcrR family transcriptional regulator